MLIELQEEEPCTFSSTCAHLLRNKTYSLFIGPKGHIRRCSFRLPLFGLYELREVPRNRSLCPRFGTKTLVLCIVP